MDPVDFSIILKLAVDGNGKAVEQILIEYTPLIEKYSYEDGKLDEDLRQHLMIHIARKITKFRI